MHLCGIDYEYFWLHCGRCTGSICTVAKIVVVHATGPITLACIREAQRIRFTESCQAWSGLPQPTAGTDLPKPTVMHSWLTKLPRNEQVIWQCHARGILSNKKADSFFAPHMTLHQLCCRLTDSTRLFQRNWSFRTKASHSVDKGKTHDVQIKRIVHDYQEWIK